MGFADHRGHNEAFACAWVRTLVSGFSAENRKKWRFLMLQTGLDESGNDAISVAFALAGYIGSADNLADMADAWHGLLDKTPKLEYVKGYEAFGLRKQFMGWSESARDDRLLEFVELIAKHSGKGIAFLIDNEGFDLIRDVKDDDGASFKDPYDFSYVASIGSFLQFLPDFGENVIDIVFDDNLPKRRSAEEAYKRVLAKWPKELTDRLLRKEPHWEDDKQFLALQAADLLAYCVRATHDPSDRHDRVRNSPVLAALRAIPTVLAYIDKDQAAYLLDRTKGAERRDMFKVTRW